MRLSPTVLYKESPAGSHLAGNPRQLESDGEASRCSRTPARPDRHRKLVARFVFIRKVLKLPVSCAGKA